MTALLANFHLERPRDVETAVAIRGAHHDSRFLAGGSDLIVNMRRGIGTPDVLIDLTGIDELGKLSVDDGGIRIGAGVTVAALGEKTVIRQKYSAVAEAAIAIAGAGHRAMATIGGNLCLDTRCIYYNQSQWWRQANGFCLKHQGKICHVAPQGQRCHAAFSGDLAPALMVLGGTVEIAGPAGRRRVPLGDLYVEDGAAHLTLGAQDLIVAVHLPANPPPSAYRKVRTRGAVDFPLAGVAVALAVARGKVAALRIGLTGTNARPFLLTGTEVFAGQPVDDDALQRLDKLVQKQVQPMRTTVASAHYRRLAAAALTRRLAAMLFACAGSAP